MPSECTSNASDWSINGLANVRALAVVFTRSWAGLPFWAVGDVGIRVKADGRTKKIREAYACDLHTTDRSTLNGGNRT